jgi:hypothetical protein
LGVDGVLSAFLELYPGLLIHGFDDSSGFPNILVREVVLKVGKGSSVYLICEDNNKYSISLPRSLGVEIVRGAKAASWAVIAAWSS